MKKNTGRKQKVVHELVEYWINVVYLAFFFGVFMSYERLILADYQIGLGHYGIAVIKALILAKVIMIGNLFRLGRRLDHKALIFPTLYKTVVFTLWVVFFNVIESTVRGLLHGEGLGGGTKEILGRHTYELLAHSLVVFFAFIPFFAFRELGRVLGEGKIGGLFFRARSSGEPDLPGYKKG